MEHTRIREPLTNKSKKSDSGLDCLATKILKLQTKITKTRWFFLVRSGIDRGRQYMGVTEKIKIGRQSDNHIQLRDPKISRLHAMIIKKGSYLVIKDMQSTNGTKVNNERIYRPTQLFHGDMIELGDTVIEIILQKD